MQERFLHFIWKFRLLNPSLLSVQKEIIEVLHPGEHNTNAGPDFLNARIRIGSTLWVGNVEIHIRTSDWFKHNHHTDEKYKNLILHLVYEYEEADIEKIPDFPATVELKGQFDEKPWFVYQSLIKSLYWIPCEKMIKTVGPKTWIGFSERLAIEKYDQISEQINRLLENTKMGWEEGFVHFLFRSFGFHVNNSAFELLAKSLNYKILRKHKGNQFQIESILFGTAGFLHKHFIDEYPNQLKAEFRYLSLKYNLSPMDHSVWRLLRLHPQNFPTIRLAQLASVLADNEHLFSRIIDNRNIESILPVFTTRVNEYWKTHYLFDKQTNIHSANIGTDSLNLLIINTVIPFLFAYSKQKITENLAETAIGILESISPEKNSIITNWSELNIKCENALDSQALIYQFKHYCKLKKCLECRIGIEILKNEI